MEPLDRTHFDSAQADKRVTSESQRDLRQIGEYRILRRLGEGGMGAVYLGYDEKNQRQVAVKVLGDQLSNTQGYVDRFYREAKSCALLNHPSIVHSYCAGQDQATRKHYLVLEYVDGPSAQALLEQFGPLSIGDAVHITLDIARALEHAHSRNIIHRDIKPDNILITLSGVSKLADLGLAKRTDEASHLTAARQGFGTPYYMPYEQAMNAKYADGRSDIYALGATLYHLLTGEVPFKGASHLDIVEKKEIGEFLPARALNSDVPHDLDTIIARMMARHPRDRYQTASELIVDLERSQLASPVPSFADPDLALQDPYVRACLVTSAQPTVPDLSQAPTPSVSAEPRRNRASINGENGHELWIVRFPASGGRWARMRLTTAQLCHHLEKGRIPLESRVRRESEKSFRSLTEYPEFQEMGVLPDSKAAPGEPPAKTAKSQRKPSQPRKAVPMAQRRQKTERRHNSAAPFPFSFHKYWLPVGAALTALVVVLIWLIVYLLGQPQ